MVESYISRVVAFVLGPILVSVTPVVANFAQENLGVNLDGDALSAYLVSTAVGAAILVYRWLQGRSEWETVVGAAELVDQAHDVGQDVLEPTVPPGLQQ